MKFRESKFSFGLLAVMVVCLFIGMTYAQDKKPESTMATPTPTTTPAPLLPSVSAAVPDVTATTGKPKSYPLPAPLAEAIEKLVVKRAQAERSLLDYIADPKIYQSEDEVVRAAMFDRQSKLFKQLSAALEAEREWIVKQRKEFNCENCQGYKTQDGKWTFAEPEPQGGK